MANKQKGFVNGFVSISAILGVLLAGTVGYFAIHKKISIPTHTPTPPTTASSTAALGEQFTLGKDQSAKITGTDLSVKVTAFYNSACPANAVCFWSGIGVGLEYTFKGEVKNGIDLVQAFGYQTKIINTDYKTFATLMVEKISTPKVSVSALATCLPVGIKLSDVVSANMVATTNGQLIQKVTVEQTLSRMSAVCSNGKLLDATGKEIYFYHLTIGCGGAVPYNYPELLKKQQDEINALKARYNVIEMTCNPSGIPLP